MGEFAPSLEGFVAMTEMCRYWRREGRGRLITQQVTMDLSSFGPRWVMDGKRDARGGLSHSIRVGYIFFGATAVVVFYSGVAAGRR